MTPPKNGKTYQKYTIKSVIILRYVWGTWITSVSKTPVKKLSDKTDVKHSNNNKNDNNNT